MKLIPIPAKSVGGQLGHAMTLNLENRIKSFIKDEDSEPVRMFAPEFKSKSMSGDWYGEHVGKWLVAASNAFARTGDEELWHALDTVVSALRRYQEPSGYLGTYAPEASSRMTSQDAANVRTWDVWNHAWMMLGLLQHAQVSQSDEPLTMAHRIGSLILEAISPNRLQFLGNHSGLSSLIVVEPLAKLGKATQDTRFAQYCFDAYSEASLSGVHLLLQDDQKVDVSKIGTGKIYQILWCALGMLELYNATQESLLFDSALAIVDDVQLNHLTPQGGPWGGIATHKEVFNARGFFDPSGMVETCSSATWVSLMRNLYERTADDSYLELAQQTLLNSILGAIGPDGDSWIYFSFPNGRRNYTYHWACCKSSGMLALEESALLCAHASEDSILVHGTSPFATEWKDRIIELHGLPEDRKWAISSTIENTPILLQRPSWISHPSGEGRWLIESEHQEVSFDIEIKLKPFTFTIDHHGQEIVRDDYLTVSWGPYSYATDLVDGFRRRESFRISQMFPQSVFSGPTDESLDIELRLPGRSPVFLKPYFLSGFGEGGWRTSWLEVAWQ